METSAPTATSNSHTYVSLHTHSTHSIGDGISTPDDLARRAAELGMPAMALTDHGRMSGLVSFEKACHEHNVKPIMGMEAYCCGIGRSRTERTNYTMETRDFAGKPGHEKSCYHLILLAKDETGYDNLCRLTTESYATGFYYKPRIDYELLHEHRDGLIVCSACVLGELSMAVQDDDIDKARRVIDWFRGEFGDDYFVEVQNHGLPMELNAMQTLRELADDSDVRTIVTNDSHYTLKGDAKLQKTVMLINRHKSWADADVRGSFFDDASVDGQRAIEDEHGGEGDSDPIFETSSELYVKSYDEMVEALRPNGGEDGRVERELANTLEIAERCEYEIPFIDPSDTDAYILPKYDVTTDVRYEEYERSSFAIPDYITKACVKELRDEGHDEVNEISDYLDASDMEALRFLMWLCEDGLRKRVIPKIDAGGNPMPEEMWIRNKPDGMHVIHTHKSPDEQWVRKQVEAGKTRDDMIQEYRDRLAYETGVVVAKRFVNYFLIVQSYVNYVRAQGEMVGPGRGCVTPDTMILTPNGAKQISKMHVGDYVYDEKGGICPITKVHQYNVHESMTDLTIFQGGHIRLTDDHMVLIAPAVHTQHYEEASNPNNKYRQYDDIAPMTQRTWVHASQIHKGDWVFVPIPSRQRTIVDRFDLAQFIPDNIKDRCVVTDDTIIRHVGFGNGHSTNALCIHAISRATGISRNALHDYIRNRVVTQQATISRLNEYTLQYGLTAEEWKMQFTGYHHDEIYSRYIDMNSDLARFVGYYIADGDVHRGVIDLAFNTNDTTYINEYAQLSQRIFGQQMSLEVHANKPNLTTGHITSPIIAAFIKSLVPDTVENKRIPQLFMEQNDAFTLSLLTGLIDGDGSIRDKGKIKYTSISKTLIYQMRFLFLSLGEIGTVFTRHHVNHPTWHDSYTLSYTTSPLFEKLFNVPDKKGRQGTHTVTTIDGYICMRVKNNAQFNYKGTVYDLTVDTQNEPSYTTEAGIIHNSGAGSLLNYLSGITSVDPIPNDLLFFRFLNKDRKGYPDIDVDFSSHGRDDILWPHLREVYGKDSTAMVAAYTYFWGKAAIKAASRVLFDCSSCRTMTPEQRRAGKDESITLSNALCDLIDNRPHLDLNDELTDETDANGRPLGNEPLKALIKTDRRYQQIIDLALMLQGMISGESQHASAYILSPHPIVDKLPLMVSKDERERSTASGEPVQDYIIQYDGREIQDQLGYVKMDLLCINDLEVITQTIKKIHDAYGVDIDIDNIPFDCKTTFDLLRQGKTAGVFQFDGSPVPKRLITEGKADSLNDLSMINALDRPGSLNMGMDKEFIERKRDKGKIEYFSPDAEDILKDTYGLACVARDSIVMTSEGEKYIQDIHVGDKVLAEDCQWHNVSAWYDKGVRETLRIRTDFGGELVCTPDHKILTSDGWVRADQLSKGMLIKGAMPSDMPHGANVRTIEPIDYKDWLIGLFLADGHSPKHGVPNISCGSQENAERIAEIARTVLPDMQNIHLTMTDGREHGSGITWHVVFSQTPSGTQNGHFGKQAVQNDMNALLKQYGLFGKVKDEKKWPEKYSFSTIIGIIEGDGTDQTQILTLKHHDLAYSVYKALLEYGIHASIYLRGDKLAWIVSYSDIEHRIRPIARDYSGHDGCNGYYIPRKYLERYHYERNIPYCVRKRYLGGTKNHMTPGVNIVKARQHFGWSCHDDEHPTWGKILSVVPDGMHHVYDITVDDNHSFLCNDLFLSNCFQESLMLLSENKNIVGFTPGEADTMRKILAHKDKAKIKGIVDKAHDRAAQNNVPKEIVDEFCDMAVASGSYSFNHCLSGDTMLYRAGTSDKDKKFPTNEITVEEVYRRFNTSAARNSPDAPIRAEEPNNGPFVICRDADGRARKHKVKNVFKQGVQPLYEVKLENGKSGKFTANHRLQVADGTYKRVDELVIGKDALWCCDFVYEKNHERYTLTNASANCTNGKHLGATRTMGMVKCGQKGYPTYLSNIVSIEYVGEDMTYDVEIDSVEHNFFANGICSHNSHSLAYALIAYRGAFLKTFFPDCFLSSVAQIKPQMKGKDKIPDYLNEARQLGVELRPPHVNWSDIGFSVPEPHVIAYGLERIKGVGVAAQTIVDERHAHGEFTDITDFCCRVPKSVTKTALKALVSAGALDGLGWTRRALEASVGDLAEFRKKWFKDKEKNTGQLSLGLDLGTSVSIPGNDAVRTTSNIDAFYADGRHHNDHGTILMPPTTEEFPPYQMMEREHEAFGMYFSVTPEDWSQLSRLEADEWLEKKRKESAHQSCDGVEIEGKRYQMINVSDVPSLPDSMRVVFTAMVEDVTPKFGDTRGYRLFKSGKGATVFLIDWGVGAEGRFGFSPSESRVHLTCFERVWNGMPKPSPNSIVLVWGRVNVSDKFPTSVIADGVRMLPYDTVRFQGRKEQADELMSRLRDIAARANDPASTAYLVPRVSLPNKHAYDRFVADQLMHAKYDDLYGTAIVTYDGCDDDDANHIMRLAQTMGMVRYARNKYGATVTKVRLPIAESELARRF